MSELILENHNCFNHMTQPVYTEYVTTLQPQICVHTVKTSSTWYALCESQLCLHWLQPATWIPAYLTACKQKCGDTLARPQQGFSLLLNPCFKHEKGSEGILTLVLFIVPDQEADKCFPWQRFVLEDELSLSVDCFLVVCVPSLSFCQRGLKKALQWHNDTPEAPHYCLTNYLQNPSHRKGRACYN